MSVEMLRRRAALEAVMAEHDVEHVLVYGANRFGSAVGWLTRWPVTREALVVVSHGEQDVLFVDFYNHVPNATRKWNRLISTDLCGSAVRHGTAENVRENDTPDTRSDTRGRGDGRSPRRFGRSSRRRPIEALANSCSLHARLSRKARAVRRV